MNKYLIGIPWNSFEGIPGIYVTDHHINGWRYFSSYSNGQLRKNILFQKFADAGIVEYMGSWDWHHVVEGYDLKPLFSPDVYNNLYKLEWPTVLVHANEEHHVLNSILHSKKIYQELISLQSSFKSNNNILKRDMRNKYLYILDQHYRNTYSGDLILQKIANNVIKTLFDQ